MDQILEIFTYEINYTCICLLTLVEKQIYSSDSQSKITGV